MIKIHRNSSIEGGGFIASFEYIRTVKPGNTFRDWLVEVLGDRIHNKNCEVRVFKLSHASHRICKYEFKDEKFSIIAKFFAIPTGMIKKYDSYGLMKKEYEDLKKTRKIIDVPEPIAINKDFNCVLVSKYVPGKTLFWYLKHRKELKEKLELIADMLRKLHENTKTYYDKENEFSKFHYVLNHLKINRRMKKEYKHLLGKWWHSSLLDTKNGCMIHNDSTPVNFVFHKGRSFLLDFDLAARHGHFACDLGILCAELKYYFARKGSSQEADSYIHHFLKHYSKNEKEFHKITKVIPFYMAYGLLRIAMLKSDTSYRDYPLREAKNCLEAIEKI
ncbi:phosphotransferase [Methanosarcina sp.]|uniref:phosphotransferase n=1 Tax=Methanosarcina sp. TaxID=2213 RepID=UPI002988C7D8|nr:phosphotransferase [Methanosarcina sp.]MDW5549041.1 phosphotransferase [Methanosarcina sp.]